MTLPCPEKKAATESQELKIPTRSVSEVRSGTSLTLRVGMGSKPKSNAAKFELNHINSAFAKRIGAAREVFHVAVKNFL